VGAGAPSPPFRINRLRKWQVVGLGFPPSVKELRGRASSSSLVQFPHSLGFEGHSGFIFVCFFVHAYFLALAFQQNPWPLPFFDLVICGPFRVLPPSTFPPPVSAGLSLLPSFVFLLLLNCLSFFPHPGSSLLPPRFIIDRGLIFFPHCFFASSDSFTLVFFSPF